MNHLILVICFFALFTSFSRGNSVSFIIPLRGLLSHKAAFLGKNVKVEAYLIPGVEGAGLSVDHKDSKSPSICIKGNETTYYLNKQKEKIFMSSLYGRRVIAYGFFSDKPFDSGRGILSAAHLEIDHIDEL